MDGNEILAWCGVDLAHPPQPDTRHRVKAKLSFLGAERYVLGTKYMEVDIDSSADGFKMEFVGVAEVEAGAFLGPNRHMRTTVIHDVYVEFEDSPMPGLSMANLHPGVYPRVLRDHEILRVSG
jgi:hypothetical protein